MTEFLKPAPAEPHTDETSPEPSLSDLRIPFICPKCAHEYKEVLANITSFLVHCPGCNEKIALSATDISAFFTYLKTEWGLDSRSYPKRR